MSTSSSSSSSFCRVTVQESSSTDIVESSVSLLVAKTQFTLAVQIAIEALMNKCGYSRERATTALLKELNRSSSSNNNTNTDSNNYVAGIGCRSGSGTASANANFNNVNNNNNNNSSKPTDDEVRIVVYGYPYLTIFSF